MQSNAARALVAAGAVVAVAIAFVAIGGGDEESGEGEPAVATTTTETETGGEVEGSGSGPTGQSAAPPGPATETIVVRGGEPVGGVQELSYERGERVRIAVESDVDEHVHVHGYDLFEDVAAGGTARFSFRADIDGVFEIELEDSQVELAQLTVEP